MLIKLIESTCIHAYSSGYMSFYCYDYLINFMIQACIDFRFSLIQNLLNYCLLSEVSFFKILGDLTFIGYSVLQEI